jgi:hypothetical protein
MGMLDNLQDKVEHYDGKGMLDALRSVPPSEHLAIIKQLQKLEASNSRLNIDIKSGSTPDNFDFTITHNPSEAEKANYSLKIPPEALAMLKDLPGGVQAVKDLQARQNDDIANEIARTPVLHETYNSATRFQQIQASTERKL